MGLSFDKVRKDMENKQKLVEEIKINKLIPYVNNARTHSAEQNKKLQASLREFGFVNPILVKNDKK